MKVAITTASGQLGRAIIQETINKMGKENVVGIARTPVKAQDLDIEIRQGDYDNQSDLETALQGVDIVLMVSGMDTPDKRIGQHRNVIESARKAGVRKIVYTSIYGEAGKCSFFDTIILSNRQTERDIQASGLDWVIGRNGLYIDEDLEAIPDYKIEGKIANCARDGKCAYTSRKELAYAYTQLILDDTRNGQIYNLCGDAVTQQELTGVINEVFGECLTFESMSVEEYVQDRTQAHGEFLGQIIAGIYQGIREGAFDVPSDYKKACGRDHQSLRQMAKAFKSGK